MVADIPIFGKGKLCEAGLLRLAQHPNVGFQSHSKIAVILDHEQTQCRVFAQGHFPRFASLLGFHLLKPYSSSNALSALMVASSP